MSKNQKMESQFDHYGRLADIGVDAVYQNGRYKAQTENEKHIPSDVISKLRISDQDDVLDVGCGMGLNLLVMAEIARSVTGCDHESVIAKLKEQAKQDNITFEAGNFLEVDFGGRRFDRILSYSVLHSLPNEDTLFAFIDKALSVLNPKGRMLLGDLANTDKKRRFMSSARGKKFAKFWEEKFSQENYSEAYEKWDLPKVDAVVIDDEFVVRILTHIRDKGFHAYVLDQPQNLPFGNTREDILVIGPEYNEEKA